MPEPPAARWRCSTSVAASSAAATANILVTHPHPGWVEQDVEVGLGRHLSRESRGTRCRRCRGQVIRSIALSSQRGSFILLDEHERALAPSILWNDTRAQEMEAVLAQRIAPERFRRITGMPIAGSWAVAKLAWLLRHRADLMARTRHICNGQEYFLRRLGADFLETDPSSLTLNAMLDIHALDWSDEICAAAGVDRALLPPVGEPGARMGGLSATAAAQTGLPRGAAAVSRGRRSAMRGGGRWYHPARPGRGDARHVRYDGRAPRRPVAGDRTLALHRGPRDCRQMGRRRRRILDRQLLQVVARPVRPIELRRPREKGAARTICSSAPRSGRRPEVAARSFIRSSRGR